jgi:2,3-bisphosphoglycerate-dependent phosphoglycerate mutase
MPKLILLRHGQSIWNQEGRFTGWMDIDLSAKGREEAKNAGVLMRSAGFTFDIAFTSVLKRAVRTLWIVQEEMDLMWVPVIPNWRLNERFYGDLQGKSKNETEEKFGAEQVHRWRRGFRDMPPALKRDDERCPMLDPRYSDLADDQIPVAESLEDTLNRMLPFWQSNILPELVRGKDVFVAAHGNTLRALVKHLESISDEEIEKLEIPTGVPLVYDLDGNLRPKSHFYLEASKMRD